MCMWNFRAIFQLLFRLQVEKWNWQFSRFLVSRSSLNCHLTPKKGSQGHQFLFWVSPRFPYRNFGPWFTGAWHKMAMSQAQRSKNFGRHKEVKILSKWVNFLGGNGILFLLKNREIPVFSKLRYVEILKH